MEHRGLRFLPVDGSTPPDAATVTDSAGYGLGAGVAWLSPSRYLAGAMTMSGGTTADDQSLVSFDIRGGTPQRLTTVRGNSNEHVAWGFTAARDLALTWQVRPAPAPDRGPKPLWWWLLVGVPAALVAMSVAAAVILVRGRRHR